MNKPCVSNRYREKREKTREQVASCAPLSYVDAISFQQGHYLQVLPAWLSVSPSCWQPCPGTVSSVEWALDYNSGKQNVSGKMGCHFRKFSCYALLSFCEKLTVWLWATLQRGPHGSQLSPANNHRNELRTRFFLKSACTWN